MASRQRERRRCLEVLGVQEDATDDDIRKAYRRMALIFHPDKNQSEDAKEKFQEISYAYKYLTEGPSAVGFEEDGHFSGHAGGHDVPIDILIRLFPWMTGDFGMSRHSPFGGLFGHPFASPFHHSPFDNFFMNPLGGMHSFDDSDSDEEIVVLQNGRITVMKTGNRKRNFGRRPNRQRQYNHDPFRSRFHPRHQHPTRTHDHHNHHDHHSHHDHDGHHDNHSHHDHHTSHPQSHTHQHSHEKASTHSRHPHGEHHSRTSDDLHGRHRDHSHSKKYDSSSPVRHHANSDKSTTNSHHTTGHVSGNKSTSKSKPATVITSRKERKMKKKANKAAKSTVTQEKTTPSFQEETTTFIDLVSDEDTSTTDDVVEISSTDVPLKLNKKQRRKLKRERERLEKEMAQTGSNSRLSQEVFTSSVNGSISPEVIDVDQLDTIDVDQLSNSSATNDTDYSSNDARSRRARKNEKKKQKSESQSTSYTQPSCDHLFPKSRQDEEEMVRIAMEMSKMEVEQPEQPQYSKPKPTSVGDEGYRSFDQGQGKGNNSWYDDIGSSPFDKSPMEDMKKTYYKDMPSSQFDPSSYYRSNQPACQRSTNARSSNGHHQSNKENYKQSSMSNPQNFGTRYFYSHKPSDDSDGRFQGPVNQHHQKYFKSYKPNHSAKHSIDLDEPDDVPLNLNDSKPRGTQNGHFKVGDVLNSSLNVPKGIHLKSASCMYSKK